MCAAPTGLSPLQVRHETITILGLCRGEYLGIEQVTYALRAGSRALLAGSKPAFASGLEGAAADDHRLLMAVRGHLGGTRRSSNPSKGAGRDLPFFRPDISPVGADRASVYALPPVADGSQWLLPLLS